MKVSSYNTTDEIVDKTALKKSDISWLKLASSVYKISPDINDYILVSTLICPSDIPNRNGIAFPIEELTRFGAPPNNRMAYMGWKGCPVHYEHDNEDPTKAYGIILDVSLRKIRGYNEDKLWKVMGVLGIDKNKNPEIAKKIADGSINTYSMGAMANVFTCSICGDICSETHHCEHVRSIDVRNFTPFPMSDGKIHLAFLNARFLSPIETSIVGNPAWAPALSDNVLQL